MSRTKSTPNQMKRVIAERTTEFLATGKLSKKRGC